MKRIYYVSRFSHELKPAELEAIQRVSQQNNPRKQITGFLVCLGDTFFQVLEGPVKAVDHLFYEKIMRDFDRYLASKGTWFAREYETEPVDQIAYLSMEFGMHESLPIYAGGLGILAADYCKAMSNLWVPFAGVGLLYRQGYFTQQIDCGGLLISHPTADDYGLLNKRMLVTAFKP